MDARERLRLYLEQRRELGEQELVLDRLDVDDVLRMVGALGRSPAPPPSAPAPRRLPPPSDAGVEDGSGSGARVREETADRQPARPVDAAAPPASHAAPPTDERRSDDRDTTPVDWRETLRAAGGGPPGAVAPPVAGRPRGPEEENEMSRRTKAAGAKAGGAEGEDAGDAASDAAGDAATAPAPPRSAGRAAGKVTASAGAPVQLPAWAAELDIPAGLSVGESGALDDIFARLRSLDELARMTEKCTRCPLYRTATHAVPGEGNHDADLVCVGEAPGANEDASGRPFVGAAGQLLTKILAAINLSREDVFICNVLKHRPPGNRNPEPDEVEACSPYLLRQLELVKPKVILTLGAFAAQTLLATKTPIGKLRGQVHLYHGIPLVVTYHPAALLRNSAWKRPTWEDVQLARRLLDRAPGSGA